MEKITEDILNKKTGCLKDWLVEVSEESDIDSDVITARSLLSRLEKAIKIYESIPAERLHGIKGIGFDLQDRDADMIGLVCNTIRKLFCMSDEGYEIFLMDLEDYKAELEEEDEE